MSLGSCHPLGPEPMGAGQLRGTLGSQQKHSRSWSRPTGLARPRWVALWHFLWLRSRRLHIQDVWKVAPWGHAGAGCEARLAWSAPWLAVRPLHPILHYAPLLPSPLPGTAPWATPQGVPVLCRDAPLPTHPAGGQVSTVVPFLPRPPAGKRDPEALNPIPRGW